MQDSTRAARMTSVISQRLSWVRCAAEHLYHRHNVSAVLRTCDAFGVHDVHMVGPRPFTPSRGPSRGVYHWLRLHEHPTPAEAIATLKQQGYAVWVADFAEDALLPSEVPIDRPICLWFGAELVGVSPAAREAADGVMTIPMRGFAQSLNISVAAALALANIADRARATHGSRALLTREDQVQTLAAWHQRDQRDLDALTARQRAVAALGTTLDS